jgi:hypothetical protein
MKRQIFTVASGLGYLSCSKSIKEKTKPFTIHKFESRVDRWEQRGSMEVPYLSDQKPEG